MIFLVYLANAEPEKDFQITFNSKMWVLQWELVEGV